MRFKVKKKRTYILLCVLAILIYLFFTVYFKNFSHDNQKTINILIAYDQLLQKSNSLRILLVLIDIKVLKILVNEKKWRSANQQSFYSNTLDNEEEIELNVLDENSLENVLQNINSDIVTLATFDVFFKNKKQKIFKELSQEFIIYQPSVDKSIYNILYKQNPSSPSHLILTHKTLNVKFHLVVLRSFTAKYYTVDQIIIDNGSLRDSINGGLNLKFLQYGINHTEVFESKVLENQLKNVGGWRIRIPKNLGKFFRAKDESRFIPCNKTITKMFRNINKMPVFETSNKKSIQDALRNEAFKAEALNLLQVISSAFYSLQIPFWISSGTFLGWYRQCDVLSYSGDVDVGVLISDHHPSITHFLSSSGLSLTHSFGMLNDSYELSFSNGLLKLDVFFFYNDEDKSSFKKYLWNGGTDVFTAKKYKYIFRDFKLCWGYFLDKLMVRIPCDGEKYIEDNYGTEWMKMLKSWDWRKSPANVFENGFWSANEMRCCVKVYT